MFRRHAWLTQANRRTWRLAGIDLKLPRRAAAKILLASLAAVSLIALPCSLAAAQPPEIEELPPVVPLPLPPPAGAPYVPEMPPGGPSIFDVPPSRPMLDEQQRENPELAAAADGYGSGNGFVWTFWGWVSYFNSPQADISTFRGYEAEIDVTKSFSGCVAASADIDFYDTNEYYNFVQSGAATPHIEQLFLSVMLPETDTICTFGKFNTPFGIEPRDFWNRVTGTVSLLFPARPEDLTGVMITQPFPDYNLVVRPMVVNGFNQNIDVNQQPSVALMVEYKPWECLSMAVTNWYGAENYDDNHDHLYFIDGQVKWCVNCRTKLQAECLFARTESPWGVFRWSGAVVIGTYDWNEKIRLFAQWSMLDDPQWWLTPVSQEIQEFNIGFSYFLHPHVEIRTEYRHDISHRAPGDVGDPGYYQYDGMYGINGPRQDLFSVHATFGY